MIKGFPDYDGFHSLFVRSPGNALQQETIGHVEATYVCIQAIPSRNLSQTANKSGHDV